MCFPASSRDLNFFFGALLSHSDLILVPDYPPPRSINPGEPVLSALLVTSVRLPIQQYPSACWELRVVDSNKISRIAT
jgi:hypothetical protein